MIRKSIEAGTQVWHGVYGNGVFQKFINKNECIVTFEDGASFIFMAKDLNEVVE